MKIRVNQKQHPSHCERSDSDSPGRPLLYSATPIKQQEQELEWEQGRALLQPAGPGADCCEYPANVRSWTRKSAPPTPLLSRFSVILSFSLAGAAAAVCSLRFLRFQFSMPLHEERTDDARARARVPRSRTDGRRQSQCQRTRSPLPQPPQRERERERKKEREKESVEARRGREGATMPGCVNWWRVHVRPPPLRPATAAQSLPPPSPRPSVCPHRGRRPLRRCEEASF